MIRNYLRPIKRRLLRNDAPLRCLLGNMGLFLNDNDRKLHSIAGASKNRDAVVIGMGPSFRPEDVRRFDGYTTFACNKIFLMQETSDWRPDFYAVTDPLVGEHNHEAICSYSGTRKFIHPVVRPYFSDFKDIGILPTDSRRSFYDKSATFNRHPIFGIISGGGSVLLTLIQMAYWAGAKNIYMVGVDFSFEGGKKTGESLETGDEVLVSEGEVNHFHPNYRKKGETWTVPKYEEQAQAFTYSREALRKSGVNLVNASRTTKLDVLEHIPFDQQFSADA